MHILKLITLLLLVSNSHAGSLYNFNYYDVYSKVLELASADQKNKNYELYSRRAGFAKDTNEFILAFFLKYKVTTPKEFNYLCLKINASGHLLGLTRDIKPVYNDVNIANGSCYVSGERSHSGKPTIYDVNYKSIEDKFNQLIYKNRTTKDFTPESRIGIYSFIRKAKDEPRLYMSSYYKYQSNDQVIHACQIINENGELVSFLEDIPEKLKTSYFGSVVSKPSMHCTFN